MMFRAVTAFALWMLPAALWACEGITAGKGLPGRSTEVTFSNAAANGGKHAYWAGRSAQLVFHAGFDQLTDAYGHNILGPVRDAKHLAIHWREVGSARSTCPKGVILPEGEVFEDIAPRIADLDGDGEPEIIVVQSNAQRGAKLAVYNRSGKLLAATPNIGTRFRWLAPIGAADLDGDGHVEIAYVDRPHLAKTIRVWRYRNGALEKVGDLPGFSNHKIGEPDIAGGIRDCGKGPEMIVATANWARVVAIRFQGGAFKGEDFGPHRGRDSFARAMAC